MRHKTMKERELEKLALLEWQPENNWIYWFPKKQEFLRFDIFGAFDFLALNKKSGVVHFVQITTTPNRSARRKKIQEWIDENWETGEQRGHFWLWAWDKKEARFKKECFT